MRILHKYLISLLVAINIILVYIFFIEPLWIETTRISIPLSQEHAAYDGLTIVHISDLHLYRYSLAAESFITRINKEHPDVICITGDIIGYNSDFTYALPFLNRLQAPEILIVLGNSDYTSIESFFRAQKETPLNKNIILLRNEAYQSSFHDHPLLFFGIDDPISGYSDIHKAPLPPPMLSIVLTHAYTEEIKQGLPGFDLFLAGHTHGGQVYLPFTRKSSSPHATSRIARGLFTESNRLIYITRGMGMSVLPVRFLSRPEISVLTFYAPHTITDAQHPQVRAQVNKISQMQ